MMNIYEYHNKQDVLNHFDIIHAKIPKFAYEHAKDINEKFPEGEKAIAKDPEYSYLYAKNIIKGAFPLGEKAIAQNAEYSCMYSIHAIQDRFLMGEAAITKSKFYAYYYAKHFSLPDYYAKQFFAD